MLAKIGSRARSRPSTVDLYFTNGLKSLADVRNTAKSISIDVSSHWSSPIDVELYLSGLAEMRDWLRREILMDKCLHMLAALSRAAFQTRKGHFCERGMFGVPSNHISGLSSSWRPGLALEINWDGILSQTRPA